MTASIPKSVAIKFNQFNNSGEGTNSTRYLSKRGVADSAGDNS